MFTIFRFVEELYMSLIVFIDLSFISWIINLGILNVLVGYGIPSNDYIFCNYYDALASRINYTQGREPRTILIVPVQSWMQFLKIIHLWLFFNSIWYD